MPLAVRVAEVATPEAFVTAVWTLPANVALAPEVGALNVTVTPATGLFEGSVTVTTKGAPNAVFVFVLWPVPLVAVSVRTGGATFVRKKVAGPVVFVAVAVML